MSDINPYKLGKEFEAKAYEFLKTKFDKVIWLSDVNWKSPVDFECYKDDKRFFVECKKNFNLCRQEKPMVDYFVTQLYDNIVLIPYSEVREDYFKRILVTLSSKDLDWIKNHYKHEVYFFEQVIREKVDSVYDKPYNILKLINDSKNRLDCIENELLKTKEVFNKISKCLESEDGKT